jgi:hypothetical protein
MIIIFYSLVSLPTADHVHCYFRRNFSFRQAQVNSEATSLDWKSQCLANPSVPLLRLADKKSRIYWVWNIGKKVLVISKEYLDRNKLFFYNRFAHNLPIFIISKNLAEHWDLSNTGIFYSKDVASKNLNMLTNPLWNTVKRTLPEQWTVL